MKGRSHRLQSHDVAHEDWVDGSWTVDCVCGVNFDDGEEMVNCDECGVWVHTRCSRYVKGDESFACDKCKGKNNRNDSEETEVAQLLVELPTKTIRLESSYPANGPPRRPFRLWSERPMDDRVHVQGIPGGDPSLFTGLSSIFTPELWKCRGYVPKKFNFQYREFPCWDEKELDVKNEEENENTVSKGAGVLFSLSKERVLKTPVAALVGMRGRDDEAGSDRRLLSKDMKWQCEPRDPRQSQFGVKKERGLLQPVVMHSGKRKKEDPTFNDRIGKKKARAFEKEMDLKKRSSHISKTAFTSTSDAKPLEFYEDRHPKSFKNDTRSIKNKIARDPVTEGHISDSYVLGNGVERPENNLARHDSLTGVELREGKSSHEIPAEIECSTKAVALDASMPGSSDVRINVKEEGENIPDCNQDDDAKQLIKIDVKPSMDMVDSVAPAPEVEENLSTDAADTSLGGAQPGVEGNNENSRGGLHYQSSVDDGRGEEKSCDNVSENSKLNDATLGGSQSDHKAVEDDRTSKAAGDCHVSKVDEFPGGIKQESEASESLPSSMQECQELKHGGSTKELSKSGGTILDSPASAKMIACIGKPSSASSTAIISKSSISDLKSADCLNSNLDTKQQVVSESNSDNKDQAPSNIVRDAERHENFRKTLKEHLKPSVNSVSQGPNSGKVSHTYVTKRTNSDSKELLTYSSYRQSMAQNSCENSGLQNDASHAQNKAAVSGLPLRGEKYNHSGSHSSSKANHASSMNPHIPTNSPATLSDEELALLLHQELNSSPRVPRVPRVRNAGSLPQLASPTATSMLIKRTSCSGGKDHSLVSRRKNKDISREGFRRSHNLDNEPKKMDRVASSSGHRRHETGYKADGLSNRDDNGSTAVNSMKKSIPPTSTSTANSGPSSSTEVNDHHLTSVLNSPRNICDEEASTVAVPIHRTLPGLINEIMSKGRRMTYEELCNAVLPHWHNLRKHNGERYAYSSHSQAVLDCLRNRQEWAQLVDRGPKTNSSRKRRRHDTEESEDNDYGKGRSGESKSLESQREDFPKGKRKARKRRRLALQGRGIKDVRSRRKAGVITDDDSGLFSNSSEDSLFSDDEIQGSGAGPVGSEASGSSDEMGTM